MVELIDLSKRNPKYGDEPFVVCHWDTFDNETFKLGGFNTLEEATKFAHDHYGDRIRDSGADKVEIVDSEGNIVWRRSVG